MIRHAKLYIDMVYAQKTTLMVLDIISFKYRINISVCLVRNVSLLWTFIIEKNTIVKETIMTFLNEAYLIHFSYF